MRFCIILIFLGFLPNQVLAEDALFFPTTGLEGIQELEAALCEVTLPGAEITLKKEDGTEITNEDVSSVIEKMVSENEGLFEVCQAVHTNPGFIKKCATDLRSITSSERLEVPLPIEESPFDKYKRRLYWSQRQSPDGKKRSLGGLNVNPSEPGTTFDVGGYFEKSRPEFLNEGSGKVPGKFGSMIRGSTSLNKKKLRLELIILNPEDKPEGMLGIKWVH